MRKITKDIFNSWQCQLKDRKDNTSTDGSSVWLHDNEIVKVDENNDVWIKGMYRNNVTGSMEVSSTTKERLKPWAQVSHKNHQVMLNGKPWDGEWINISSKFVAEFELTGIA